MSVQRAGLFRTIARVFSFSILAKGIGALAMVALIRMLSPDQYATYTMVIAVTSVMTGTIVSTFNRIYIVGFTRFNLGEELGAFFAGQVVIMLLIGAAAWPVAKIGPQLHVLAVVLALSMCSAEFVRTAYQRELRFRTFSYLLLAQTLLFAAGVLLLTLALGLRMRAWHALLAQTGAALAAGIPGVVGRGMLRGITRLRAAWKITWSILSGPYRYLFGYLLMLAVFSQMDVFMLKTLADRPELACYGSAFQYYRFLLIALSSAKTVYLPVIQESNSSRQITEVFRRHRLFVSIAIPVVLLGCLLAGWVMPWVDKGKYPDAPDVFRILALSAVLSFAFSPHIAVVLKAERFLFLFVLVIFGFALNFGANLLLIPTYGARGAACATLLSYGVVNGAVFLRSRNLRRSFGEGESPVESRS